MRARRTQTSMSSYQPPDISCLALTWDRSENELRLRLGHWTETSNFRTGLNSYHSHVNGDKSQTGCRSNMFLLFASSFLLFLSGNDSISIVDNISKQDVESSINWIYACVNAWESTVLRHCTAHRPPNERCFILSSVNSTVVYWGKLCTSWFITC